MKSLSDAELLIMEVLWGGQTFLLGEVVEALKIKNIGVATQFIPI